MKPAKFIKIKLDWGDRIFLPESAEILEDKRKHGGEIEIWRKSKLLWAGHNMRQAKKWYRGFSPLQKEVTHG